MGSEELLEAVKAGDAGRVRELLRREPDLAILFGHDDVAVILLERGADPNLEQAAKFTALDTAAFHDDREMIELLMAHGARARNASA